MVATASPFGIGYKEIKLKILPETDDLCCSAGGTIILAGLTSINKKVSTPSVWATRHTSSFIYTISVLVGCYTIDNDQRSKAYSFDPCKIYLQKIRYSSNSVAFTLILKNK